MPLLALLSKSHLIVMTGLRLCGLFGAKDLLDLFQLICVFDPDLGSKETLYVPRELLGFLLFLRRLVDHVLVRAHLRLIPCIYGIVCHARLRFDNSSSMDILKCDIDLSVF